MEEEDTNVSSSSEVISKYLVTFKDISELQEQNQKLRQVNYQFLLQLSINICF